MEAVEGYRPDNYITYKKMDFLFLDKWCLKNLIVQKNCANLDIFGVKSALNVKNLIFFYFLSKIECPKSNSPNCFVKCVINKKSFDSKASHQKHFIVNFSNFIKYNKIKYILINL